MAVIESASELGKHLESWSKGLGSGADPVPTLQRIAELIEKETETYYKMDPDPFEDRHPSRVRPDCTLGILLKMVFKNDEFMTRLVTDYVMSRDKVEVATAACRLLIDLLPGLESSVVFQDTEGLVTRLFDNATKGEEPLKSYAIGLLAAAMEVQDIAINFKEQNMALVPVLLRRLKELSLMSDEKKSSLMSERPFAVFRGNRSPEGGKRELESDLKDPSPMPSPVSKRRRISSPVSPCHSGTGGSSHLTFTESNSSWAEIEPLMIGSVQLHPLSVEMQQRFILQYLTPMGDYQELLYNILEEDAMGLILHYIDLHKNGDVRLAFEALKYLAALLCHKKFAVEFLNRNGLQKLLQVYRPSVAATGVSICLYYLAYSEDAMERICQLPKSVLSELVTYALWLLECSHDSSRCHATMFFGLAFAFRIILELFDEQDGLRKLLNVMFLLDIFAEDEAFTEDELIQKRQTARHVCVSLKKYFEAHLVIESENMRRSASTSPTSSNSSVRSSNPRDIPPYKPAKYSAEVISRHVENMLELMPLRINWKPVDDLIKWGGVKLLINLIAASANWLFSGKADAVKSAMDVLVVCSVVPKFQLMLTENVTNEEGIDVPTMNVILKTIEGERLSADPEVIKSALNVIINCVSGPLTKSGASFARLCAGTSAKKKSAIKSGEEVLLKMWRCVKDNDGVPILLNLLTITSPITEADAIRTLACRAICGLARFEDVRQIIGKRPIFQNGQLQSLMKEPVLQDKRSEHVKFCKYCMDLIFRVTGQGSPISTNFDISPESLNKAEVVAQTKILYNEKELLELIHTHLVNKGFRDTADTLSQEAGLPFTAPRMTPSPWPSTTPILTQRSFSVSGSNSHSCTPSTNQVPSHHQSLQNLSSPAASQSGQVTQGGSSGSISVFPSTPPPFRRRSLLRKSMAKSCPIQKPQVGDYQPSPVLKKMSEATSQSKITLDSIVTEYLRKQHALCKNPIVTCPRFDLFEPHRCPEPLNSSAAPLNMTVRIQRKQIIPKFGGMFGKKFDRKFIYSRFKPIKTFKDSDGTNSYTACAFSNQDEFLFLGTVGGEMATYNLDTGSLVATYNCHDTDITYIEPSKDGKSIITCSLWRSPVSALWSFTDVFDMKMSFEEDYHVEYGKQFQDKAIGTKNCIANLYDLNVGKKIGTFHDESISNKYYKNQATFSYTDELVLNDGVLWDVRSSSVIHKFDKFNKTINGVFHPNGWEVIANAEIWDLRTYHLLKTVPALDQCRLKFNSTGDVIYGAMFEEESSDDEQLRSPFGSSFRTFDATDYSNIATIDVKKTIFDLAVDPHDNCIAVVENQMNRDIQMGNPDTLCRLYEVGRSKEEDEDVDEDEEEEGEDEGDTDEMDESEEDYENDVDNTDDIENNLHASDDDPDPLASDSDDDGPSFDGHDSGSSDSSDGSDMDMDGRFDGDVDEILLI